MLQIAIASGKGGTGKTTLATNLASIAAQRDCRVTYVDCDVEEPNGHVFLRPTELVEQAITKWVPQVDAARCRLCGDCGAFCQYGAIVCVGKTVMVYPESCHSCGGCSRVCSKGAIQEVPHAIGRLRVGLSGAIHFVDGMLNVGQPMGPPAIRAVKDAVKEVGIAAGTMSVVVQGPLVRSVPPGSGPPSDIDHHRTEAFHCDRHGGGDLCIIDSPPGTSCSMVEAVRGSDVVVLITEPTPFGVHDLELAFETIAALNLPVGVVINRAGLDDESVHACCRRARVPILGSLPDDRVVAEAYSRGQLACDEVADYGQRIGLVLDRVLSMAGASCAS